MVSIGEIVVTNFKSMMTALVLLHAGAPALSEAADDVAALRGELKALQAEYAKRITALESRITQLEAGIEMASAMAPSPPTPSQAPAATQSTTRSAASAFNPAMSIILAGTYVNASEDPETWGLAGFIPSGGEVGPGERSFGLGESELTLSASVDPYFSANLTAAIAGEDEIAVEEAYFRTLALHSGLTLKGGRFFSQLGYLNEQHAHVWDFVDQPLVYQAFFGGHYAQDGVQLKWLAPTDLFVELGAEAGNGQAFPGTRRNRNGLNGATLFGHVGGDVGDSTSWRAGVSWLDVRAEDRAFEDVDLAGNPVVNSFAGTSRTWIADAVLKWTPPGDTARRQLELQAEYMRRTEEGDLTFDFEGLGLTDTFRTEQSGWYLQSVYQFLPRWRAGIRYDALDAGTPTIGLLQSGALPGEAFANLGNANPDRTSVMLDWSPSEFSRLRAQYAWDDARDSASGDRQFLLQYLFGIGAHAAHRY
jgi:hypothetical protein